MTTAARGQTIQLNVDLITETCCNCHVLFALSSDLRAKRLSDKQTFYCPNGHPQAYIGESDATRAKRLERELKSAQENADWYAKYADEQRNDAAATRRSLGAVKGQVTKLRKRAVAGTCPFGCRRHFANLERHVATKHEGQALEGEA